MNPQNGKPPFMERLIKKIKRDWLRLLLLSCGLAALLSFLYINYWGQLYHWYYEQRYVNELSAENPPVEYDLTLDPFAEFEKTEEAPTPEPLPTPEVPEVPEEAPKEEPKPAPKPEVIVPIAYTERSDYSSYDMTLIVPRMGLKSKIIGGTDAKSLKRAPGLYETCALPMTKGANVCIAAHRDVYGSWFYSIDKMKKGDVMKLWLGDMEYVYTFMDSQIVAANDWSITKERDYSALTITSCHPKGTSENRIAVTGKLVEINKRVTKAN